jgi:phosphate transport system permease protein
MLIAVPVSFGTAIFLVELSPDWARRPIGTAIELLAAIPSIIYGMWGLFVFAPFMAAHVQPFLKSTLGAVPGLDALVAGPPLGIGMLTASIILAFMVVPFVCAIMRDVLLSVPPQLRESAYAIGCTTWETVWRILVPQTRAALIGATMLGLGRALGETMAVTFVIGNAHVISASLLAPGNTIASTVANEFTEAVGDVYQASLIALGLTLFAISFGVLALAKQMLRRLDARAAT